MKAITIVQVWFLISPFVALSVAKILSFNNLNEYDRFLPVDQPLEEE
jgi:hypothetical protein